jgi:hypothetical protein
LLMEEQRTNLVTYSEDFSNASWSKTGSTVTANTIVAPDGTLTGDALVESATLNNHFVTQSVSKSASAIVYTGTVYAKTLNGRQIRLALGTSNRANGANIDVNLETGIATAISVFGTGWTSPSGSASFVDNGWYRISLTVTSNTDATINMFAYTFDGTNQYYTGDGYSGIYIWGAQLEEGSFPTSYIKTEASQVTRSGDYASMTGTNFSDWYNDAEGTLYAEASLKANGYSPIVMLFNSSGATQANQVLLGTNVGKAYVEYGAIGGGTSLLATSTVTPNTFFKSSIAFTNSNVSLSANGGTVAINTTIPTTPIVNSLRFAHDSLGRRKAMTIKKLSYYPQRLSNAQLQAITS